MAGQLFAATGEGFELLVNWRNGRKARKNGLDAKTYRKKVATKTEDLDIVATLRSPVMHHS